MARRRRQAPGCSCINAINDALADRGVRLSLRVDKAADGRSVSTPRVMVEDIEAGSGLSENVNMLATYCPWCGNELEALEAERRAGSVA
jgi:hypothetical protein